METIKNYIDGLFKSLPDTAEVKKAKAELLNMMEDKYNELKHEGKSENEAIGIVISEFGNIDEIVQELGLEEKSTINSQGANGGDNASQKAGIPVNLQTAKDFLQAKVKSSILVAVGVFLCIISPVTILMLSGIAGAGMVEEGMADAVGIGVLFVLIAIAVGLFIFSGSGMERYEYMKREVLAPDERVIAYVSELKQDYAGKYTGCITLGVVLCILSVIPVVVAGCIEGVSEVTETLTVCLLLVLVAIAVFIFIAAGCLMEAYNQLLQKKDYTVEMKEKKEDELTGKISAVYWPLVTAGYLLWSFLTGSWGITWIVWPVAGILFGAIAALCSMFQKEK